MVFIESLLDRFEDYSAFEKLCSEVMQREGYPLIDPVGGTGDKGRDAEEKVFQSIADTFVTFFQFSLQKRVPAKVRETLRGLKNWGLSPNRLIFIFGGRIPPTTKDSLTAEALEEYALNIEVRGQQFLATRLSHPSYRDITTKYFARELEELRTLWEQGSLFEESTTTNEHEQRCLVNLMFYARHPMAEDIRRQIISQAIRTVLSRSQSTLGVDEVVQMVADYLPAKTIRDREAVLEEIEGLVKACEILGDAGGYTLSVGTRGTVDLDVADIVSAKQAVHEQLCSLIPSSGEASMQRSQARQLCEQFLSGLFRRYGNEVARAILLPEGVPATVTTCLTRDVVDEVLSEVLGQIPPVQNKAFRAGIHALLANTDARGLPYLQALASSYILMQMLNIDPNGINVQRARIKESVAVLDTDVVLTGIVDGADRQGVSQAVVRLSQRVGMHVFATQEGVQEIVYRIERSIQNFNDLGQPGMIPQDKTDLISDLFLEVYFRELARGTVGSFGEFIREYYNVSDPRTHIEELIGSKLGVPVEPIAKYYLKAQDERIKRIKSTIEGSRKLANRFKMPDLYFKDAKQMVVVDQQNREALAEGRKGRWYLVSGDKHIMGAYVKHKEGFCIKPCVLPAYFAENLRNAPEAGADRETFGAILHSEAMLRGPGKDYTAVMAALSQVGIKALEIPRSRLLALIDDMDRADFTQWLLILRSSGSIDYQIREEVQRTLEGVLAEAASREQIVANLRAALATLKAKTTRK